MSSSPLVSIIICTHNRAAILPAAIRSILAQTHRNLEIIVMDDGSSDHTRDVVASFLGSSPVRYLHQENQGQPIGRNAALDQVRGDFIAFLDDDDELYPDALTEGLAALDQHPDAAIAYSDATVIDDDGHEIGLRAGRPLPSGDIYEEVVAGRILCLNGAFLARRECFRALRYDPEITQSSDVYIACRLAETFRFVFLPKPMLKYRRYADPKKAVSGGKYRLEITRRRYGLLLQSARFQMTDPAFQKDIFSKYHLQLGRGYARIGEHRNALIQFITSLRLCPSRLATWHNVATSLVRWLTYRRVSERPGPTPGLPPVVPVAPGHLAPCDHPARPSARGAMMSSPPLVSVIICTFNRADLLRAAIQSVLSQTYPHLDIVVVDDGSTDHTASTISTFPKSAPLRYIHQENKGVPTARDTGIDHARGDFIAFLDDDDELYPDALEQALSTLDRNPEADIAYSDAMVVDESGREQGLRANIRLPSGDIFENVARGRVLCLSGAFLARQACFVNVRHDPLMTEGSDVDLTCRLAEHFRFVFIPRPMLKYRRYADPRKSMSGGKYRLAITRQRYGNLFRNVRFQHSSPSFKKDIFSKYHLQLGRGYAHIKEYRKAIHQFLISLSLSPFRLATWHDLTRCLIRWTGVPL